MDMQGFKKLMDQLASTPHPPLFGAETGLP